MTTPIGPGSLVATPEYLVIHKVRAIEGTNALMTLCGIAVVPGDHPHQAPEPTCTQCLRIIRKAPLVV